MTTPRLDQAEPELLARFRALRDHDFEAAPEFDVLLAPAAAHPRPARRRAVPMPAWAAGLGVLAVPIAVWLIPSPRPTASDLDALALPGWRTPTDSLLADAAIPLQRASWTTLPTAALGQPSFTHSPEIRR